MCTPVTVCFTLTDGVRELRDPRHDRSRSTQIFTVTRLYRIARRLASGLAPRRASALRTRRSGATGRYLLLVVVLVSGFTPFTRTCVMLMRHAPLIVGLGRSYAGVRLRSADGAGWHKAVTPSSAPRLTQAGSAGATCTKSKRPCTVRWTGI